MDSIIRAKAVVQIPDSHVFTDWIPTWVFKHVATDTTPPPVACLHQPTHTKDTGLHSSDFDFHCLQLFFLTTIKSLPPHTRTTILATALRSRIDRIASYEPPYSPRP